MAITPARYSAVAMLLHWTIALLILGNIGVAWYFNTLHGMAKIEPVQLHKSIGITVLLLSLVRIAWRLAVPPPRLPAHVRGWERALAQGVHIGFYGIMLGLPLTGWALSSASPLIHVFPIVLFHLVPWPAIGPLTTLPVAQMKAVHDAATAAHHLLAKLAYALIALHLAGVLKHQFISRDEVAARMIPFLKPRGARG
jgi:cytochrome b561